MNSPTSPDSPSTGERLRAQGREQVDQLKEAGRDVASRAKQKAEHKYEQGAEAAARVADETTEALDRMGADLESEGHETLAKAAFATSARLSTLARYFETRTLDELTREAGQMARNNPALMIAGGIVLGLALSRFFKGSSAAREWHEEHGWDESESEWSGHESQAEQFEHSSGSRARSNFGDEAGLEGSQAFEGGNLQEHEDLGRRSENLESGFRHGTESTWRQP